MSLDLIAALASAESLARHAGALLREASKYGTRHHIDYKGPINLVTETDRASEILIVAGLRSAFPEHGITGEEGSSFAPAAGAPDYRWHVDPLDGTTNFAHGIPHFSVTLALAGPDGVPLVGVVYDPIRYECFTAIKGQGATLNGQVMRVSRTPDLVHSAVSSGFPYDRASNPDNNSEEFSHFITRAQSTSRLGSAALDLAYVAAGRLDGFWEMRINSWDVMAGLLLVTEAGGRITNYHGKTEGLYEGREVVASNGLIHDRMMSVIILGDAAPKD
jgi:myo-inositol-1(or 4)-monophosphatase